MESDNKCRHRIYAVHTQEEIYKTNSPGFKVLDPLYQKNKFETKKVIEEIIIIA